MTDKNSKKSSNIDAFVMRYPDRDAEKQFFTKDFLNSPDFDVDALKRICRKLELPVSANKEQLAAQIAEMCRGDGLCRQVVIESLIERNRTWGAIWTASWTTLPSCSDPCILTTERGNEEWYGPIRNQADPDAKWYIRPSFIRHLEVVADIDSDNIASENVMISWIRWLCFARVKPGYVTLHWKSFTHVEEASDLSKSNAQFQYWNYIPNFRKELQDIFQTRLEPLHLYGLVLDVLWHKYRSDRASYEWEDIRIRAESGGVALNARSARRATVELDFRGIHRLANTLRRAVELELSEHEISLPTPERFEEVILQTLIKDFGALSYEFCLSTKDGENLFRGHSYFGGKPGQPSPDGFPHIKWYTSFQDDLKQLDFLLSHANTSHGNGSEPEQFSLFS